MRDRFGQDAGDISEGAPPPPTPTAVAVAATPPPAVAPTPAQGSPTPTVAQAIDKAVALQAANQAVATDPNAIHAVNLLPGAPSVLGSTVLGAALGGLFFGGPPGALGGALIGFITEKYQVLGGPVGKAASWLSWMTRKDWATVAKQQSLPSWIPNPTLNIPGMGTGSASAPASGPGSGTGS